MFDKRKDAGPMPPTPQPSAQPAAAGPPQSGRPSSAKATIGPTIVIDGRISGDEDVVISGQCEGTISLPKHTLTIQAGGHVRADVVANVVQIEGQVEGDVDGVDKVVLTATGRMEGNIKAPRVIVNDGAKFKGSIDMDPEIVDSAKPQAAATAQPQAAAPAKPKLTGDGRPVQNPGSTPAATAAGSPRKSPAGGSP